MIKHARTGFEPATQWLEVQNATYGLLAAPVMVLSQQFAECHSLFLRARTLDLSRSHWPHN